MQWRSHVFHNELIVSTNNRRQKQDNMLLVTHHPRECVCLFPFTCVLLVISFLSYVGCEGNWGFWTSISVNASVCVWMCGSVWIWEDSQTITVCSASDSLVMRTFVKLNECLSGQACAMIVFTYLHHAPILHWNTLSYAHPEQHIRAGAGFLKVCAC